MELPPATVVTISFRRRVDEHRAAPSEHIPTETWSPCEKLVDKNGQMHHIQNAPSLEDNKT